MKAEELLDLFKSRRSVRKFLPGRITAGDIEKIITAASWAPSGTNKQNWQFIVISSPGVKKAMGKAVEAALKDVTRKITLPDAKKVFTAYAVNFTFFSEAPAVIAVVKKPYESVTQKILKRYDIKITKTSADVQGPSAAVENLLLMAHALGYGGCWMTGPLIARDRLEKLLGIDAPDELLALVPLGRPAKPAAATPRKEISEIMKRL